MATDLDPLVLLDDDDLATVSEVLQALVCECVRGGRHRAGQYWWRRLCEVDEEPHRRDDVLVDLELDLAGIPSLATLLGPLQLRLDLEA